MNNLIFSTNLRGRVALLLSVAFLVHGAATAAEDVPTPGRVVIYGTPIPGSGPGGGGGGGGSCTPGLSGCQTTRPGERLDPIEPILLAGNENRPPEDAKCDREAKAMYFIQQDAMSPSVLSGTTDPSTAVVKTTADMVRSSVNPAHRYSNGQWELRQGGVAWKDFVLGSTLNVETGRIVIHYMFNVVTRESEGFKFKNTPKEGCGSRASATGKTGP